LLIFISKCSIIGQSWLMENPKSDPTLFACVRMSIPLPPRALNPSATARGRGIFFVTLNPWRNKKMSQEFSEPTGKELEASANQAAVATPANLPVNEIQMRIARERPRDEAGLLEKVTHELTTYPECAEEGVYSIPYKDNAKGIITFVEGLSIRAAEHLWSRWGNCAVGARVADDRGNKIMVQGMFLDYETGLSLTSDMEVPKIGKTRAGGTYPLSGQMLKLAVAAAESKVKRNAFLGGLPGYIKTGYRNLCYKIILGGSTKTMPERIAAAEAYYIQTFKVKKADMDNLIEKIHSSNPAITPEELLRYLIGLKNAIREGNADPDFIFGEERRAPAMPQPKSKAAKKPEAKPEEDMPNDAQEPA
jgi:hypothetical protein